MYILNKDKWLEDMPELVYKLKYNYNFYFNGLCTSIQRDILEIVNEKKDKHKHKIVFYQKNQRLFIVVYRKGSPDIYICNEYKDLDRVKYLRSLYYFLNKLKRAYKKAEAEYEQKMFAEVANDTTI